MKTSLLLLACALLAVTNTRADQNTPTPATSPAAAKVPALPPISPLLDYPVRDTAITVGPDGTYYLTGTTGSPTWWTKNDGIRIWKSQDLKNWEPLGLVWSFEKDGTWQEAHKQGKCAIWAPELHYFKNNFWIAYSLNDTGPIKSAGTGILRSTTGKPEGPYKDIKTDGPLTDKIDASLFCDDDGKVYFIWQNGMIARMKDDMSGLAEEPRLLKPANAKQVGFEGAFLTKINGRYHLIAAVSGWNGLAGYHCTAASAENIYGPYGDAYLAIPHAGHNTLFKDAQGQWYSTFFGNDDGAPFRERPGILPIHVNAEGKLEVDPSRAAKPAPLSEAKWVPVSSPKPTAPELTVLLPAARDANAPGGLPLRKVLDVPLRDPQITRGGDGYFYMVGTEMDKNTLPSEVAPNNEKVSGWHNNNGIPLWRSKDLITWETMGYAWTFEKDATWQKGARDPESGKILRAIWAPEIHYIKENYWIAYCLNDNNADGQPKGGTGLLKSTTGKPEGPYTDIKRDGPLTPKIDASLFEDDDGKVYFLWQGYEIARLNDDMTGLAEAPRKVQVKEDKYLWAEGISLIKENGKYILGVASRPHFKDPALPESYDYFSSTSDSIYGPYEPMKRALPHCGHNNFFKDAEGNWWSSYFGSDPFAPFQIRPGVVTVEIDKAGCVTAKRSYPRPVWRYSDEKRPEGNWLAADFDDSAWKQGEAAFGQQDISQWGPVTLPATSWRGRDLWMRQSFHLKEAATAPSLYLRHSGVNIRIWLNGKEVYSSKQSLHDYITVPLPNTTLPEGRNVIAVECVNAAPNQYVDIGLVESNTPLASL